MAGGPRKNESLSAWKTRLQAELKEKEHARSEGQPAKRTNAALAQGLTSSVEEDAEHLFQVQVASLAELDQLTRESHETLEEIKSLLQNPAGGSFLAGDLLTNVQKLQELDRLVAMAKTLGEVATRHAEDVDTQRKEMGMDPGSKTYYNAVRSGLCNAYLAASVVGSGFVSTSKSGVIGKAGKVLKLISDKVPTIGGPTSLVGAALKAGDRYLQTRRVVKITDLAPDAVECSKLARTLALRLTDTIATSYNAVEYPTHGWGTGGSESSPGSGTISDGASEEDVMEWFVENVANYESSDCGTTAGTCEVQARRRLGKQHLHKLLKAVGRDCLQGTNDTQEKVERLLKVVIPEAGMSPIASLSAPEGSSVRSPVLAPPRDGSLDREADLSAVNAELLALKLANERLQGEVNALKLADERRKGEVGALKSEKKKLQSRVVAMEKRIPKPQADSGVSVDAGGGQLLAQKQKTKNKTMEEFMEEMENPDRRRDTPDGPWATPARMEMVEGDISEIDARLRALEREQGKKGLLPPWRRHR